MPSQLRLSNPLALSAMEAGECELPCGALDVVEDTSILCCWEFPSWHFRGSCSHVSLGRQKLQAKRSHDRTYGVGMDCLVYGFPWLFLFTSVMQSAAVGSNASAVWSVWGGQIQSGRTWLFAQYLAKWSCKY